MRRIPKGIEVVSEPVAAILRTKTPGQRMTLGSDSHRAARNMLDTVLRSQHPDWSDDQIREERNRRLQRGTS